MTWTYQGQVVEQLPEECVGFVYCITNTLTGRKYIGKKLAKFSKTTYKTVKLKNGTKKKKKIRSKIDSDWQEYYGSSPNLTADINTLGKENFSREILYYCKSKAETSYIEAREQFDRKVLESDDYYNGHIQVRVHGSHIKTKNLGSVNGKSSHLLISGAQEPGSRITGMEISRRQEYSISILNRTTIAKRLRFDCLNRVNIGSMSG
jgi:hypothetical protein